MADIYTIQRPPIAPASSRKLGRVQVVGMSLGGKKRESSLQVRVWMTVICRVVRSDARAAERPEPKLRFDPRRARTNSWRLYSFLLFFPTARHPYLSYRNSLDLGSRLHHHGLFNWIVKQQRTACEIAYVGMTDPTVRISRSTHVSGKLLIVASQIDVRLSYASAIRKIERNRCFSFRKNQSHGWQRKGFNNGLRYPTSMGTISGDFHAMDSLSAR